VENWLWKSLWGCREADNRMNEGTPEDVRRGLRRRTKGENGRTKLKKKE